MSDLKTTIGLEIHVQLKTKSKMFCRCDNNAEGKAPNTVVCPVCLGLPGALPVANEQAILWTIKTGLALNSKIPQVAKFDRKHYFYPDLPKGYQISQYDEPFCQGGMLKVKSEKLKDGKEEKVTIRLNRVHLEEDAGKLIHQNGKSLVDLNRAGTPLMEIVTEPDITSPKMAADFMRRLQKLVRDEVGVSDADMEKGHLRCDANISITAGERMSEIVEIKNLNSFKFVEKALKIEETRLKDEYPNWPEAKKKVTRGYDSKKNETFSQRIKEEASDYRYFPEPDLPSFDLAKFDLVALRRETGQSPDEKISSLVNLGVSEVLARVIVADKEKWCNFSTAVEKLHQKPILAEIWAKAIVNNYFSFKPADESREKLDQYLSAANDLAQNIISKHIFVRISNLIHEGKDYQEARQSIGGDSIGIVEIAEIVDRILAENSKEVDRYRAGKKQLLGFFIGLAMREVTGKADPKLVGEILKRKLEN